MTKNERAKMLRYYGSLYRRIEGADLECCYYCGSARETLDHCPPLSMLDHVDIDELRESGIRLLLVPSCFACNSDLGAKKLWTPHERLAFLHQKLTAAIDKHFRSWSDEEIRALGYSLRMMVESKSSKVKAWIDRLRGIENRMLSIDDAP